MRIAVGLSGGVDSAVALALLKEKGHDVFGVMMKLWNGEYKTTKKHACYGPNETEEIERAEAVCREVKVPFYIFDCSEEYKRIVLAYFRTEYMSGRTPNPCIKCNHEVKFGLLPHLIKQAGLSFEKFATGHYARIVYDDKLNRYVLMKAVDKAKDQSYFLYRLTQDQLSKTVFPLGSMLKHEVVCLAKMKHLPVNPEEESQDFYAGDYRKLVGSEPSKGDIVDINGKVLGKHNGIWNYTIGQRKGLGISFTQPLYVISIKGERNEIVVGTKQQAMRSSFIVNDIAYGALNSINPPLRATVKIRSNHRGSPARIVRVSGSIIQVQLDSPCNAITPGQSAVFYNKDKVLLGGIIDSVI